MGDRTEHKITVRQMPSFSSEFVYVARCSCRRYESGKYMYPGLAEQAGLAHKAAKETQR